MARRNTIGLATTEDRSWRQFKASTELVSGSVWVSGDVKGHLSLKLMIKDEHDGDQRATIDGLERFLSLSDVIMALRGMLDDWEGQAEEETV